MIPGRGRPRASSSRWVLQVGLFAQLPVDGARADVMILLGIAAGFVGGPERGAIVGFAAGLAIDLVLPTPLGLSALVYCIVGYLVGRISGTCRRSSWWLPAHDVRRRQRRRRRPLRARRRDRGGGDPLRPTPGHYRRRDRRGERRARPAAVRADAVVAVERQPWTAPLNTMNSDSTQIRLGVARHRRALAFGALFARLWFLQVVSADDYQALVNRTSTEGRHRRRSPAAASSTATASCSSTTARRSS